MEEKYDCGLTKGNHWFRYRAAAIIIEDGCVLFARNDMNDYYYTVGGGVHIGETSEDAVKREVFEETGINYEVDRLAFINEAFFEDQGTLCHALEFYYLMKPRGTQELHSNSYSQGARENMHWLPIEKLSEYKAFPEFFGDKLFDIPENVQHIISDERINKK